MNRSFLSAAVASVGFSIAIAPAMAQSTTQAARTAPPLPAFPTLPLNGSFETQDPFVPSMPFGWFNHGDVIDVKWPLPSPIVPFDGDRVIQLDAPPTAAARQWSTDRANFIQWNGSGPVPFFDVAFDWDGGDVEVKIKYLIPSSSPITQAPAYIKLNVKGAADPNQDNATFDPPAGDAPTISGHTNNTWQEYSIVWPIAAIKQEVLDNAVTQNWTLPPFPNRVKINIQRFNPSPTVPGTGTIYFDSISYRQIPTTPVGCNLADITEVGGTEEAPGSPDGQLTVDDLILFVNLFSAGTGCPGTAPCNRADVTGIGGSGAAPDGELTVDDLIEFVNAFSTGC